MKIYVLLKITYKKLKFVVKQSIIVKKFYKTMLKRLRLYFILVKILVTTKM